jgi:hypothetical protein
MPRDNVVLQCSDCKMRNYVNDEEQKDYDGTSGIQQVLPPLP